MRSFAAYILTFAAFYTFFSYLSIWGTILASALLALSATIAEDRSKFNRYLEIILKNVQGRKTLQPHVRQNLVVSYVTNFVIYSALLEVAKLVMAK